MAEIQDYLERVIKTSLEELKLPEGVVLDGLALSLERPTNPEFGDYSSNIAMELFSRLKSSKIGSESVAQTTESWLQNPRALATQLTQLFQANPEYDAHKISQVSVAGPGFINFTLAPEYLINEAQKLSQAHKPDQILTQSGYDRPVVVEYSSPNIAKPFTIGHLRSTIIGDAIANILEDTGWNVFRDNHLGDWGTQFGKQIYAIKTWGNEEEIENAEHPVKKLVELYVKFHDEAEKNPALEDEGRAWFKKLEEGDPEARRLWEKCITWSLKEFEKIYQQLGVTFTENNGQGYGESFFEDMMAGAVAELEEKGLLQEGKEGAKLVFYPNDQYPPLMILKKDGATLYATRDLATDKWRLGQYGQDVVVVNEVGAEQSSYFNQLYKLEELLGWYKPGQRVHVKHGLYRFADKKMSTRKGNVIWLEDVIQEAEKRALAASRVKIDFEGQEVISQSKKHSEASKANLPGAATTFNNALKIGVGALKWNDLKRSSHLDVVFDWDEIINLKGNSGPYLQYTYVRTHSILSKAQEQGLDAESNINSDIDTLLNSITQSEKTLLRELTHFDETVQLAAKEFAPHHLTTYLYQLAQAFNTFYTECSVLGDEVPLETKRFRLVLTRATGQVIKFGLEMLGIETLERM